MRDIEHIKIPLQTHNLNFQIIKASDLTSDDIVVFHSKAAASARYLDIKDNLFLSRSLRNILLLRSN